MLRVKQRDGRTDAKCKGEFGVCGRSNYIQKIHVFSILNKRYFAVARSAGLVQLYEKMSRPLPSSSSSPSSTSYKLVKEWKNSTIGPRDPVVALGTFRNQYMYTCSSEGKVVVRDLINDDADDSVKLYVVDGVVSCLHVWPMAQSMRVLMAAGGKRNSLKLYEADLASSADFISNLERIYFADYARSEGSTGLISTPPFHRFLSRTPFHLRSSFVDVQRLPPISDSASASASASGGSNLEGPDPAAVCWVSALCVCSDVSDVTGGSVDDPNHMSASASASASASTSTSASTSKHIYVGSQFGDVLVYEGTDPFDTDLAPLRTIRLSQFAIKTLHVFNRGRFLVYADSMSKVGVLDTTSWRVVNFYDHLRIGPALALKTYTTPDDSSKVPNESSRFPPIYVVATTTDGALVIYRLTDSNEKVLCLHIKQAGVVPNFDILDLDPYAALECAFAYEELLGAPLRGPPQKRRRLGSAVGTSTGSGSGSARFSDSGPGSHTRILHHANDFTTRPRQNESLANDIKTMKLAN